MSTWGEGLEASGRPGSTTPCRCLLLLHLGEDPQSTLTTDGDGAWVSVAHTRWRARWCPGCGGRVGAYRPELLAAWGRFRAVEQRLAIASPLREKEELDAWAMGNGFGPLEGESYSVSATNAQEATLLECAWDPDHERWYPSLTFAPPDELLRAQFVPATLEV